MVVGVGHNIIQWAQVSIRLGINAYLLNMYVSQSVALEVCSYYNITLHSQVVVLKNSDTDN